MKPELTPSYRRRSFYARSGCVTVVLHEDFHDCSPAYEPLTKGRHVQEPGKRLKLSQARAERASAGP